MFFMWRQENKQKIKKKEKKKLWWDDVVVKRWFLMAHGMCGHHYLLSIPEGQRKPGASYNFIV